MTTSSNLPPKILLLGGYGNTGRALAPLLLKYTTASVIISGRNLDKAQAFAKELEHEHEPRVSTTKVDASDAQSLLQAFSTHGVTLVIVLSTTDQHLEKVVRAALEAKIDYMDIHMSSPHKTEFLESIQDEITQSGLCFVTDCGFHPGLPAAMVRYISLYFSQLKTGMVGSVTQMDWDSCQDNMTTSAAEEFASEFGNTQSIVYKDSKWYNLGFLEAMVVEEPLYMDFGEPFGSIPLTPMHLEEMRCIPTLFPSVKSTGFHVGGGNWVINYLLAPLAIVSCVLQVLPASQEIMGRLLYWGWGTFSSGTILKVEATGLDDKGNHIEKTLSLAHEDEYAVVAIPVAATVVQYLSPTTTGSIRKPGLWRQAVVVEPRQFFQDLERMGVRIDPAEG
jgi:Saccharopine dehydrogenase NADP binding domain